jgi:hypothetical protein
MKGPETTTRAPFIVDAADYQRVIAQIDEDRLKDAFIGVWADREAFGQHLLHDGGAEERCSALPTWLRPYVRLDAEAFVRDMEAAGHYVIASMRRGVCVFDGPAIHAARE